jgi:hypothetical protein
MKINEMRVLFIILYNVIKSFIIISLETLFYLSSWHW